MQSPPKSDRTVIFLVAAAGIVLVAIIAGFVFLARRQGLAPAPSRPKFPSIGVPPAASSAAAQTLACQSNLNQLSLALLLYCDDYDNKTPPAGDWVAGAEPYAKNWSLHLCPAHIIPFTPLSGRPPMVSYALNAKAAGSKALGSFPSPATQILFFETNSASPAPVDAGKSLVKPGRHFTSSYGQGNNYAFLDGHVKFFPDTSPPPF